MLRRKTEQERGTESARGGGDDIFQRVARKSSTRREQIKKKPNKEKEWATQVSEERASSAEGQQVRRC